METEHQHHWDLPRRDGVIRGVRFSMDLRPKLTAIADTWLVDLTLRLLFHLGLVFGL